MKIAFSYWKKVKHFINKTLAKPQGVNKPRPNYKTDYTN